MIIKSICVFFCCAALLVPGICQYVDAGPAQNMSELRQWSNKYPFDSIGGVKFFDNKPFKDAFRRTVGDVIYKEFMDAYKSGGRYFQSGPIEERGSMLELHVQSLTDGFSVKFFLDTNNNFVDVCWNSSSSPDGKSADEMIFHDGKHIPVQHVDCDDMKYEEVKTGKYTERIANIRKELIGVWTGRYSVRQNNGNIINTDRDITISGSPGDVGNALQFKATEHVQLVGGGVFNCSNKPTIDMKTTGSVFILGNDVSLFIQTLSDERCGKKKDLNYKLQKGVLVHYTAEDKPTSETLQKQSK